MFALVLFLLGFVLFPFSYPNDCVRPVDDGAVSLADDPTRSDRDCSLCGYTEFPTSLVINGIAVTPINKYPWIVPLMSDTSNDFTCCGAVISRTFVLTAAHCIFPNMNIGLMITDSAVPDVKLRVKKVYTHPNYTDAVYGNDIALLELPQPLKCDRYTRPICLPRKLIERSKDVIIAGFGRIYHDPVKNFIKVLREGKVREVDAAYCQNTTSRQPLKDKIFCTLGISNETSCKGDSGSSVFASSDGVYYSLGVTSIHTDAQTCPIDKPVTFTNTFGYMNWVQSIVKDMPIPPQRILGTIKILYEKKLYDKNL